MMLHMDGMAYALVNGPVAVMSLLAALFFCSCILLSKRRQEEGLKQPVLLLLCSVLGCNGCLQLTVLMSVCVEFSAANAELQLAKWLLLMYTTLASMSSSTWLSVFYYSKIVPAQCMFFIWMKRNIKMIVYWGLAFDGVFFVFDMVLTTVCYLSVKGQSRNITSAPSNNSEAGADYEVLLYTTLLSSCFMAFYFAIFLVVMTSSSCATMLYLQKHMKRMEATPNSPFSCPHLQSQWRVTVVSITQAGLYLFCSVGITLEILSQYIYLSFDGQEHITDTVICLFSFGTTVNLGVGQSLFRQRMANLWGRAVQIARLCGLSRA